MAGDRTRDEVRVPRAHHVSVIDVERATESTKKVPLAHHARGRYQARVPRARRLRRSFPAPAVKTARTGKRRARVLFVELHHADEDLGDVFDALRTSENTSYVLSSSLRFLEANGAWEQFALDNNGAQVLQEWYPGRLILDGI